MVTIAKDLQVVQTDTNNGDWLKISTSMEYLKGIKGNQVHANNL